MPKLQRGDSEAQSSEDGADKGVRYTHSEGTARRGSPQGREAIAVVISPTCWRVRWGAGNLVGGCRVQTTNARVTGGEGRTRTWTKWIRGRARWRGEKGASWGRTTSGHAAARTPREGLAGDLETLAVAVADNLSESRLEVFDIAEDIDGALQALGKVLDVGGSAEALVIGAGVQCGLDGGAWAIALGWVGVRGGLASLQDISEGGSWRGESTENNCGYNDGGTHAIDG